VVVLVILEIILQYEGMTKMHNGLIEKLMKYEFGIKHYQHQKYLNYTTLEVVYNIHLLEQRYSNQK